MTSATLSVNGSEYTLPEVDGVTLQFALRDDLGLTGTKFGCGMSQCGACMVLVDGTPTTSCVTPVASVLDKQITTIEGLAKKSSLAEYGPARSLEVSTVDVVFVEDRTLPPSGIGEPAVGGVSAAVSNAIYDAVGVRVRDLPFRPDRVLSALQAK